MAAESSKQFWKRSAKLPGRKADARTVVKLLLKDFVPRFGIPVKEALPKNPVQPCHSLEPGDWVYIKIHRRKTALAPCWKGPY